MKQTNYDLVVIGGGPAGYTAALYGARAALSTLILEAGPVGGQMVNTYEIDNYPGVAVGINGFTLSQNMKEQAEQFGAESANGRVTALATDGTKKQLTLEDGSVVTAAAVILAMGAHPRTLGVPGEQTLRGRGVSYCATCDGMFFRKKTVVVVGGGNTALEDALFLSKLCSQVYLVHRRDTFRGSPIYVDKIRETPTITTVLCDTVSEILGDKRVTGVRLASGKELACDGVFVAVGNIPNSDLVKDLLPISAEGYVSADETTTTALPGVFVAGDLRQKPLRQIVTAAADGAVAAYMAEKFLIE